MPLLLVLLISVDVSIKKIHQNSCHLASSPLICCHLFDAIISCVRLISRVVCLQSPLEIQGCFCCIYLISSFCKFLSRCRPSQSLFGQGTEINKERDSGNDRGWVQKRCHTVRWLCWASWHRPMFCKLFICTQIAFHSDTKRVGYWCCMWEVCAQILLSDNRITMHASWACFESLLLNLHIQPGANHFVVQQIKLLPSHF